MIRSPQAELLPNILIHLVESTGSPHEGVEEVPANFGDVALELEERAEEENILLGGGEVAEAVVGENVEDEAFEGGAELLLADTPLLHADGVVEVDGADEGVGGGGHAVGVGEQGQQAVQQLLATGQHVVDIVGVLGADAADQLAAFQRPFPRLRLLALPTHELFQLGEDGGVCHHAAQSRYISALSQACKFIVEEEVEHPEGGERLFPQWADVVEQGSRHLGLVVLVFGQHRTGQFVIGLH